MSPTFARLAGPAALCAALLFASAAPAVVAPTSPPGASPGMAAKERAHGRQCAPKRVRGGARSPDFAKCVVALAKLASGASSSPKTACRTLSRKRTKRRRTSPFERCVKAGTTLVKKARGGAQPAGTGDPSGDPSGDDLPGDGGGTGPDGEPPIADPPDPLDSDAPPLDPDDLLDSGLFGPVAPDVP